MINVYPPPLPTRHALFDVKAAASELDDRIAAAAQSITDLIPTLEAARKKVAVGAKRVAKAKSLHGERAAELAEFQAELAARDVQAARTARRNRIEAATTRLATRETALAVAKAELAAAVAAKEEAVAAEVDAAGASKAALGALGALKQQLAAMKSPGTSDPLAPIRASTSVKARTVQATMKLIADNRASFRVPPIGPLCQYITVKDPAWQYAVEAVASHSLMTFLVADGADANVLENAARASGARMSTLSYMVSAPGPRIGADRFKSPGGPAVPRLLDMLSVDNDWAFNQLVEQMKPDKVLLVGSEGEGEAAVGVRGGDGRMVGMRPGISYALLQDGSRLTTSASGTALRAHYPGQEERGMGRVTRLPRDTATIAALQAQMAGAQAESTTATAAAATAGVAANAARKTHAAIEGRARKLGDDVKDATSRLKAAESEPEPEDDNDEDEARRVELRTRLSDAADTLQAEIDELAKFTAAQAAQEPEIVARKKALAALRAEQAETSGLSGAEAALSAAVTIIDKLKSKQEQFKTMFAGWEARLEGLTNTLQEWKDTHDGRKQIAADATKMDGPRAGLERQTAKEAKARANAAQKAHDAEAKQYGVVDTKQVRALVLCVSGGRHAAHQSEGLGRALCAVCLCVFNISCARQSGCSSTVAWAGLLRCVVAVD